MKKLLLVAAAASLSATASMAQTTVTTTTTGTGSAAVQIEPESRSKIRTYVTEHKVRPITTQEKIIMGGRVPSDVELEAVPPDWGPSLTKYHYFYSGDRVMLVDPGTRTVVQEID
jgi:uncharacterized protein DUF1236